MKKSILITAIGSASANSVINSLLDSFRIVGTNIYPKEYIATSVLVDSYYEVSRADKVEEYIKQIIEICERENCKYVLPLTDPEIDVLNDNRELFEKRNITLCISNKKTIEVCRNKRLCATYLSKTEVCRFIPEIDKKTLQSSLPVIVKKVNGRSSEGQRIIKNKKEYDNFLEETNLDDSYLVQPFIEGNIVTVDVLRCGDDVVATMREELLRTNNGLGLSVRVFNDASLQEICRCIAIALDITGCVCFEFIKDLNGVYWFLECNPRFSGGIGFSILTGYDYPLNHMNCFCGNEIKRQIETRDMYIARMYTEVITN